MCDTHLALHRLNAACSSLVTTPDQLQPPLPGAARHGRTWMQAPCSFPSRAGPGSLVWVKDF